MTEKQYPELPESGSGRNMTMAAFLRQPPNVKEPIYMAALDKAAIEQQRIIDADRAQRGVEPAQRDPLTEAPLPLLIKDFANELGTTSIAVCTALRDLGFGCYSLNMAVTPTMAAALREHFAAQPQQAAPSQDAEDAARFRYLTDDHASSIDRAKCRSICDRLSVMSYSAACAAIDAARSIKGEGK